MKKIISILMLIVLFSMINEVSYATSDFIYTVDNNNCATITAYKGNDDEITIPNKIDGYQVIEINSHAFDESRNSTNGKNLKKVTISEGITTVGDFAFVGCINLENIVLPESLTYLGDQTFIGCSKLSQINIPSNLKSLRTYVFQETGFTEFTIPEGFQSIGDSDFRICTSLKSFKVYSKDVVYADNVFEYCSSDLVLYGYNGSTTQSYAENNGINFKTLTEETNEDKNTYQGFQVLGKIEIPKIDLKSPVLSKVTKKSLEVAPAVLYPENPKLNSIGNNVIVGHNYKNGTLFSDINKLTNGDDIYITDNNDNRLKYIVYKVFEASETDTSFYNRDTNGNREITLTTATDDSKNRLIVLAKEANENNTDTIDRDKNINNNSITSKDNTIIDTNKLPHTGKNILLLIFIFATITLVVYFYFKYKKLNNIK